MTRVFEAFDSSVWSFSELQISRKLTTKFLSHMKLVNFHCNKFNCYTGTKDMNTAHGVIITKSKTHKREISDVCIDNMKTNHLTHWLKPILCPFFHLSDAHSFPSSHSLLCSQMKICVLSTILRSYCMNIFWRICLVPFFFDWFLTHIWLIFSAANFPASSRGSAFLR